MAKIKNVPTVTLGVVGVSRDCFPAELTKRRLDELMRALKAAGVKAHKCSVVIESEADALNALDEMEEKKVNAAAIYLGNFGPEGPTTYFAENFPGPVMVCAAAEEDTSVLASERGDALCGMLNCSYNLGLRRVPAYIPQMPVGLPDALAGKVADFVTIARIVIGVRKLKIFGFGPRPQDFLACNAPIQPLYDLGVSVMENSELDLFQIYTQAAEQKNKINAVVRDMKKELGAGCSYPDLLPKLAQFEVALLTFMEANLGAAEYAVFADKCWPAFEAEFGFVPCYVNGRMASKGIPVACEVDMYGALSEYMCTLATGAPATLLDINNSCPDDVLPKRAGLKGAEKEDLFMGFHCGNTCAECMKTCSMKYQLIMNRLMEDGKEPDITRGTLEGQLKPGPMTLFRLQGTAECELKSYVAEGEILDIDPQTFGGTGIIAIPGFARFYRHVLIAQRYPHHAAVAFGKTGRLLWEAVKLMGVDEIGAPLPKTLPYPGENPFELFR